jgi:hypothetical protein
MMSTLAAAPGIFGDIDMEQAQMERIEKKNEILQDVIKVKVVLSGLQSRLKQLTPMADQLVVAKDIEKTIRYVERVQAGLGGIVV